MHLTCNYIIKIKESCLLSKWRIQEKESVHELKGKLELTVRIRLHLSCSTYLRKKIINCFCC